LHSTTEKCADSKLRRFGADISVISALKPSFLGAHHRRFFLANLSLPISSFPLLD
jgi:hypothetical protein